MKKTFICFLLFWAFASKAQDRLSSSSNTLIHSKIYELTPSKHIWWKCDSLRPMKLFTVFKDSVGLGNFDSMALIEVWVDSTLGWKHYRYNQYYKGYKIQYTDFQEHTQDSWVKYTNGHYIDYMDMAVPSTILTDSLALIYAKNFMDCDTFLWEVDSLEIALQNDSIPGFATYFPTGKLLWALKRDSLIHRDNYVLCKYFEIMGYNVGSSADSGSFAKGVYVNAVTGEILKVDELRNYGDFNHFLYGSKSIDTKYYGGLKNKHFLWANDNGHFIKSKSGKRVHGWSYDNLPSKNDDHWGNQNWDATAAHWTITQVWDYWKSTWKRHGWDDHGYESRILVNSGASEGNNYFHKTCILSFETYDLGFCGVPDIGGHEYNHGNLSFAKKFTNPWRQPLTLNESYGDIFGILADREIKGTVNWTIGEECTNLKKRSLQNPLAFQTRSDWQSLGIPQYPPLWWNHPNHYKGDLDFGGIHINNSIQNYCFYMLCNGGTNYWGRTVIGIGIDKAARIAHHAMLNMGKESITHQENRDNWIDAAKFLFGACSIEAYQTCKAWSAVNIGDTCLYCPFDITSCFYLGDIYNGSGIPVLPKAQNQDNLEFPNYLIKNTIEGIQYDLKPINGTIKSPIEYTILSMSGQQLKRANSIDSDLKIDLGMYPSGVYIILIRNSKTSKYFKLARW